MRINETQTMTIANGQTTSGAQELGRFVWGSITVPGTMTGTTIAFHVCNSAAGTYRAVEVEGNEANPVTFATGRAYRIPAAAFNYAYLKLVSNATELGARDFSVLLITP